jgi:hypothetical protein
MINNKLDKIHSADSAKVSVDLVDLKDFMINLSKVVKVVGSNLHSATFLKNSKSFSVVKEADKEEANEEDKQLKKGKTLC